ncbi:MAG TPA: arylesterase [Usitatibacteraceae bacterium]|nr:arylesterase [Usitatibacteraceae bacterium]
MKLLVRLPRRAVAGLAAALLAFAALPASAQRTLLVLGDSLSAAYGLATSQGWVSLLGERIARDGLDWRVVNASVSGETTAGGLRRLPEDLKRHRPNLVVIALGANDGLRGQPVAAMRANLEEMIRLARAARADPVLVGLMIPPNYGIDYAREFRELYPQLARKARVPLVPFLLDGVAERRDLFLPDQLHPSAEAQPRILANVWPTVEPLLKGAAKR